MSETAKTRHLVRQYCRGNVLDVGSGGFPVVDWAIQMDLHRHHVPPHPPVQFVDDVFRPLPFKDAVFDAVFASHVLEDAFDWVPILREWVRVLKPGGHIVLQVPDKSRFRAAVASGKNAENHAHKHESYVGELTKHFSSINKLGQFKIIMDRFEPEDDYNIIFCAKRL